MSGESEIGSIKKKLRIWLKLVGRMDIMSKQLIETMTEYYSIYENQGMKITKAARQFINEMLGCEDPTKLTQFIIVFGNTLEMSGNLYISHFSSLRVELEKERRKAIFQLHDIEELVTQKGIKILKKIEQYETDFLRASKEYKRAFIKMKEVTKGQGEAHQKELKYFVSTKEKIDEKIKAAAIQLEEKETNLKTITEKNNQLRQTFNKQIVQLTKQIRKYLYEDPKGLFDFFKGSLQSDYELRNSFNELIQDKLAKLNEAYGDVKIGINKEIFHNIYFTNNLDTIWDGNITSEFDIDKYVKDSPKLIDYSDKFLCMRVIVSQHLKAFGKILLDEENSIIKFCTKQKKGGIKIPSFHQIRSQAFIELLQEFRTFFGNLGDIHQKIHTITYEKLVQESKKVENIQKKDYESFKETKLSREQKLLDISNYLVITRSELEQMNLTIRETKLSFQTANEADFHDLETIIIEIREQEQGKRFELENFIEQGKKALIEDSNGVEKYLIESNIQDEKNIKNVYQLLEAFQECTITLFTNLIQHLKIFSEIFSEIKIEATVEEWLTYYENKYKVSNILGTTAATEISLNLYHSDEAAKIQEESSRREEQKMLEEIDKGAAEQLDAIITPLVNRTTESEANRSHMSNRSDVKDITADLEGLEAIGDDEDSLILGSIITPKKEIEFKGFPSKEEVFDNMKHKIVVHKPLYFIDDTPSVKQKVEEVDSEDNMLRKLHFEPFEIENRIPSKELQELLHQNRSPPEKNKKFSLGKKRRKSSTFKHQSWIAKKFKIEDKLLESFSCALSLKVLLQGTLYVTSDHFCFHSFFNHKTIVGSETKIKIAISNVKSIEKKKNAFIFDNSIMIQTDDNSEFFLTSFLHRDQAYDSMIKLKGKCCEGEDQEADMKKREERDMDMGILNIQNVIDINTNIPPQDEWFFNEIEKLEEINLSKIREEFVLVKDSENSESKLLNRETYSYPIQFATKALLPLKGKFQDLWAEECSNCEFVYPEKPDPDPQYFTTYQSNLPNLMKKSKDDQEALIQISKSWPLLSKYKDNYWNIIKGAALIPLVPKSAYLIETVYKFWISPNYVILLKVNDQKKVPFSSYFYTEVEIHIRQKLIPEKDTDTEPNEHEVKGPESMIKYRPEIEITTYGQTVFRKKTYFRNQIDSQCMKQIRNYYGSRIFVLLADYMRKEQESYALAGGDEAEEEAHNEIDELKKEMYEMREDVEREGKVMQKEMGDLHLLMKENMKIQKIMLILLALQLLIILFFILYYH